MLSLSLFGSVAPRHSALNGRTYTAVTLFVSCGGSSVSRMSLLSVKYESVSAGGLDGDDGGSASSCALFHAPKRTKSWNESSVA